MREIRPDDPYDVGLKTGQWEAKEEIAALRAVLAASQAEIKRLEGMVARLWDALRTAYVEGDVPGWISCRSCYESWEVDAPEQHALDCILVAYRAAAGQGEGGGCELPCSG